MNKAKSNSSKRQRQLIAIACSQLALGKEDKIAMLHDRYGKSSTTELTFAQAEEMIDDFVAMGFVIKSSKRRHMSRRQKPAGRIHGKDGKMVVMASPAELAKVDALSGLISWRVENGQERWMKKRFGISRVKTASDAFVVIEGLKKMFENQMKKRHGEEWYALDFEDIEICYYIADRFSVRLYGLLPAHIRIQTLTEADHEAG